MKRAIHTMTPEEFRAMTGEPNLADTYCAIKIMHMSTSLVGFHRVMGEVSNFDSITWLLENDFDLNFTEARKDGYNLL